MTKQAPLLCVRALSVEAGRGATRLPILSGVSFEVRPGEVLGIIGESGAGKSTLGLAAMGYLRSGCRVTGGEVVFDGQSVLDMPEQRRRALRGTRITYVAQSAAASFNPAHRLMEQATENRGLESRKSRKDRVVGLFSQMNLPQPQTFGERFPHQVSGGQLQRAMTSMAMAPQPDLIVFDEPTTALDVTTQVEVLSSIRNAVRIQNTAALYITHDLAVVSQMADRIIVLRHGKVVEEAETQQMIDHPAEDYTRSLWAVRNIQRTPRSGSEPALSVRNIRARYGRSKFDVLTDINVDFDRGRTTAIVGESGSGKSTLGRVICGLLAPYKGEILLGGADPLPKTLAERPKRLLKRVQLVHQSADTALNPRHSVREILSRPIQYFTGVTGKACERRVAELMQLIELPVALVDRRPGELSGGQKQRVNLARALAAKPDIIICDEVTSALDQVVQHGILKLLMNVQQETGVTYAFITHDIATVRAIADKVVVMSKGRVVEQGDCNDVLRHPKEAYTELLLSSVPKVDPGWLTKLTAERASQPATDH